MARYLAHLHLLRSAPKNLRDYFRVPARRKVDKDRTVTLNGKLYEAPVGLIGRRSPCCMTPRMPSAWRFCSKRSHTVVTECLLLFVQAGY